MGKTVLILAHPNLEQSTMNNYLIEKLKKEHLNLEIHHIDQLYPTGEIDVAAEKEMLMSADLIMFQFPIFWYNAPHSLRNWLEVMLEKDWAYGANFALTGKKIILIMTAGGTEATYQYNHSNSRNIENYMYGFYEMFRTVRTDYVDSFYIFESNANLEGDRLPNEYKQYLHFIQEMLTNQST